MDNEPKRRQHRSEAGRQFIDGLRRSLAEDDPWLAGWLQGMDGLDLVVAATSFAAERHAGQRRKDAAGTPYINHPIAVLDLLRQVGDVSDANILAAGLLHDTVEDTATTAEELEERFGPKIASLVMEVTDDKSLPKQARKRLQVVKAPRLSTGARQVKLADKIANLSDLLDAPPADWDNERMQAYARWSKEVVEGCRAASVPLARRFDAVYERAEEVLGM